MTVIAALTDGITCWVGGDAAGVGGQAVQIRTEPKVFTVRSQRATSDSPPATEYAIGTNGSPRMRQLLQHGWVPPALPTHANLMTHMCTTFIDAIRARFQDGGWARKEDDRELGGNFIVGVDGHLFEIFTDYHVAERDAAFTATGAGEYYALGSLYTTEKISPAMPPNLRLATAMEAAAEYCTSVRPPFHIVTVTAYARGGVLA